MRSGNQCGVATQYTRHGNAGMPQTDADETLSMAMLVTKVNSQESFVRNSGIVAICGHCFCFKVLLLLFVLLLLLLLRPNQ